MSSNQLLLGYAVLGDFTLYLKPNGQQLEEHVISSVFHDNQLQELYSLYNIKDYCYYSFRKQKNVKNQAYTDIDQTHRIIVTRLKEL